MAAARLYRFQCSLVHHRSLTTTEVWFKNAPSSTTQRLIQLRQKFSQPGLAMSFKPLYNYIDRDTLAEKVRQHASDPSQKELAIVDVRDDDFPGGNIVGAQNVPSATLSADSFDKMAAGPLREFKTVVFHCHLSQQRGPKAAGQYAQACNAHESEQDQQQVLVLRGGFSEFQDKFKKDPAIVENYDASSWQYRN